MWHYYYYRAHEIAAERIREAERDRLARQVRRPLRPSVPGWGRRAVALAAAGLARRFNVQGALSSPACDEPGLPGGGSLE